MDTGPVTLADRLREARRLSSLTQSQVADLLGLPRELISMWETAARAPGDDQLRRLARAYRVPYERLAGLEPARGWTPAAVLFRKADGAPAPVERRALEDWLGFLDRWAERLPDLGPAAAVRGRGLRKPPRPLDPGGVVLDSRRAPSLAAAVRRHYNVGDGPLPDLYAFLDAADVLVYRRADVGAVGSEGVISGAFVNHPEVGFSIFVNTNCSAGRQAFTLAHELAHALFHYPEHATVSRVGDRAQEERFANAFASHLLVPGRELRRLAKHWESDELTPYGAIQLAAHFRVSYAMMLYRLHDEGLLDRAKVDLWRGYSPTRMAELLGLPPEGFCRIQPSGDDGVERLPLSVRWLVGEALGRGDLVVSQAADILGVEEADVEAAFRAPPPGDAQAEAEVLEFPF